MAQRKYGRKITRKSFDSHGECPGQDAVTAKIENMISIANYDTDPYGSYTGVPIDPNEVPVQDADDL